MLFVALSGASSLFGSSFVRQYTPPAHNIVGDGRMSESIPIPTQKESGFMYPASIVVQS